MARVVPRRLQRKLLRLAIAVAAVGIVAAGQALGWWQEPAKTATHGQPGLYNVKSFADGDTITVEMGGREERIRMIGVDTPETHKPNAPVQCYGPEASAYTKQLIGDEQVRLEADPQSSNRDRYNRLLRYVYLADGRLVEAELIKGGYGFAYTYFPFTKSAEFTAAQKQAQEQRAGLWTACQPTANEYGGYTSNNL